MHSNFCLSYHTNAFAHSKWVFSLPHKLKRNGTVKKAMCSPTYFSALGRERERVLEREKRERQRAKNRERELVVLQHTSADTESRSENWQKTEEA